MRAVANQHATGGAPATSSCWPLSPVRGWGGARVGGALHAQARAAAPRMNPPPLSPATMAAHDAHAARACAAHTAARRAWNDTRGFKRGFKRSCPSSLNLLPCSTHTPPPQRPLDWATSGASRTSASAMAAAQASSHVCAPVHVCLYVLLQRNSRACDGKHHITSLPPPAMQTCSAWRSLARPSSSLSWPWAGEGCFLFTIPDSPQYQSRVQCLADHGTPGEHPTSPRRRTHAQALPARRR